MLPKPPYFVIPLSSYAIIVDCWYSNPQQRPKFSCLVQQYDDLLEQEAGYLDLGSSLNWKEHVQPQAKVSKAPPPPLLSVKENVKKQEKEGVEMNEINGNMSNLTENIEKDVAF